MIDGKGQFDINQLILGEFGIWKGEGNDVGYSGSFTDEERQIYYNKLVKKFAKES